MSRVATTVIKRKMSSLQ